MSFDGSKAYGGQRRRPYYKATHGAGVVCARCGEKVRIGQTVREFLDDDGNVVRVAHLECT